MRHKLRNWTPHLLEIDIGLWLLFSLVFYEVVDEGVVAHALRRLHNFLSIARKLKIKN